MKLPKNPRYKLVEFILMNQTEIKKQIEKRNENQNQNSILFLNCEKEVYVKNKKIYNPSTWLKVIDILRSKLSEEQNQVFEDRYVKHDLYVKTSYKLHISESTYNTFVRDIRFLALLIAAELGLISIINE